MEKAKPELLAALKGSDLEITDFIWYGGDSNYENIEMLKAMPEVQMQIWSLALAADVPLIL